MTLASWTALAVWMASIVATGLVARRKRRLVRSWVAGAIFTAWFALVIVSVLPPLPPPGQDPEALATRLRRLEEQLASERDQGSITRTP